MPLSKTGEGVWIQKEELLRVLLMCESIARLYHFAHVYTSRKTHDEFVKILALYPPYYFQIPFYDQA